MKEISVCRNEHVFFVNIGSSKENLGIPARGSHLSIFCETLNRTESTEKREVAVDISTGVGG